MELELNDLVKDALELSASYAAIADTSMIKFHEDFRKACEKNICRKYDSNWMGPPAIGPIDELIKKTMQYRQGLLFQTDYDLKNTYDYNGMMDGMRVHEESFRRILNHIKTKYKFNEILPLNAGCCSLCPKCAYLDNEPCRHPEKAVSSIEAYGIDVLALKKSVGIPLYSGKNKVSYVGIILFNASK